MMNGVERYTISCQGQPLTVFVKETPTHFMGKCFVPTPNGMEELSYSVPQSVVKRACAMVERQSVETGRRGRRRRRGRRQRGGGLARRIGRGQVIRRLGNAANRVLNSRVVKGAMKVARMVPGYGQAINAAYNTATRATEMASRIGRGDRNARQTAQRLRQAAQRSPQARQALQRVRSSYMRRFGGDLGRIRRAGGAVGAMDMQVVTGAQVLGLLPQLPPLISYGVRSSNEVKSLRDRYREGLRLRAQ